MITQADLDECHAWIEASAELETRNAKRETSSEAPHPDEPAAQSGAGASVLPLRIIHGTAPAPAVPVFPRADQVQELGRMIETLRIVSEETRAKWIEIAMAQEKDGFPDFTHLDNATAHLLRLSSDLHNHLLNCQCRLQMSRLMGRGKQLRKKNA